MKTWRTLLAMAGLTGGMLAGGLFAAIPADAQPYYQGVPPPAADHRRFEDHRIAEERRIRERERLAAEHRQWVVAHWEYRDGHRYWHEGYWR